MHVADVAWATDVGIRRRRYALENDVRYDGAELNGREPWAHSIVSAGAELAVARHKCEPWNAYVGDPRLEPADVGKATEVRWADGLPAPSGRKRDSLIVRPDRYYPERTYYLVLGPTLDELVVVGWLPGSGVNRDRWRFAPNGRAWAWFVPRRALWPAWLPDYGPADPSPQLALFDERGTA